MTYMNRPSSPKMRRLRTTSDDLALDVFYQRTPKVINRPTSQDDAMNLCVLGIFCNRSGRNSLLTLYDLSHTLGHIGWASISLGRLLNRNN